jgi:hypothetical protein
MADENLLQSAVHALIASGASALPPAMPLHVAVWVERGHDEGRDASHSPVPPGVGVDQINTVRLRPGELPNLLPPTRAVASGSVVGPQAPVAVVRVCSPGLGKRGNTTRAPAPEPAEFARCRDLIAAAGGRAWSREDPLLGPTYSFSVPLAEAH